MNVESGVKTKYQHWAVVAILLMLTATMASVHQFKIPTIMNEVTKGLNMSLEQAALAMSIITFIGIFLAVPAGGVGQKYGPKKTIVIAAVIMAVGSLIGAFATSGSALIFSRGIEGIGYITITICGPIAITQYVAREKLGSAMGIFLVWVSMGQIIAFNLTPPLYHSVGYRGVWITYALLSLVAASFVLFGIKTRRGTVDVNSTEQSNVTTSGAFKEILKNRDLWFLCLAYIAFNAMLLCMLTYIPTFLMENGVSVATAGFVASLPMLLALVASPMYGAISDKIGSTKVLFLISLFALMPGAIMMFSSTGALMYIGVVIAGLLGMGNPAMAFASIGKVNPKPELAGAGMGFLVASSMVGMFIGPMLVPFLFQMGGTWSTMSWVIIPITVIGVIFGVLSRFK